MRYVTEICTNSGLLSQLQRLACCFAFLSRPTRGGKVSQALGALIEE